MALADDLDLARDTFLDAMYALMAVVSVTTRGFAQELEMFTKVQKKLAPRLEGCEQPPPAPGETVELKFTEAQARWLLGFVERQSAAIERRYPQMLLNMALIYLVALCDAFITDSYRAVLVARPEMLRSGKHVTYETALSFVDRQEMIEFMAEREVGEMAYKSFREQMAYYKTRFGVDLDVVDDLDVDRLVELMARRNVLVHNNGVANKTYLAAVANSRVQLGHRLEADDEYWQASVDGVRNAVREIHDQLVAKFAS